ncbi:MAG: TIGR01906 family membrane protein [Oscillospiraceae bacterium]|jgi:integral membrane protein (TIGR01906 family)|nr:TIGR01906 family membrane protein [Oscillospiraceae bacterium]
MKRFVSYTGGALTALSGLLAALLFILLTLANIPGFYMLAMERAGVPSSAGVSQHDLSLAIIDIVEYLRGADVTFDREIIMDGEPRPEFGARERDHMKDVRALFSLALRVAFVSLAMCIICAFISRIGRNPRAADWGALSGTLLWVAVAITIFIISQSNFLNIFTEFHKILFTNDLWQLDPRTDLLIRMMPTPFFIMFAAAIGGAWAIIIAAVLATCIIQLGRNRYIK